MGFDENCCVCGKSFPQWNSSRKCDTCGYYFCVTSCHSSFHDNTHDNWHNCSNCGNQYYIYKQQHSHSSSKNSNDDCIIC